MPLQQTSGNDTTDAYGGGAAVVANYIEDVFSTYLYTGNGSSQTITNEINVSGQGGLVWLKNRTTASDHTLCDSARGSGFVLASNLTDAQSNYGGPTLTTSGFSVPNNATIWNAASNNYVSWTFRKQPKFFDVVTYTGTGSNRTIAHSLGSVPGCIIVKRTNTTGAWQVYHSSLANTEYLVLNTTAAKATGATRWNSTTPTSAVFSVGTDATVNASGGTYVAYIFAHDAGGFGLTGTDNVISCGSFTTNGSGNTTPTNLGYEPQFLLVKRSDGVGGNWVLLDIMRQLDNTNNRTLYTNLSDAEGTNFSFIPNATGFSTVNGQLNFNATYIYIAIRRGPMKTPTTGTSVFSPIAYVGANGAAQNITAGFPVDMDIIKIRNDGTRDPLNHSRLMGGVFLKTDTTSAQASFSDNIVSFSNAQNVIGLPVTGGGTNEINGASTSTYIGWSFKRAPGFFDVVCYTGTGANTTITHNLGVVPELIIVKKRSVAAAWQVYSSALANTEYLVLNTNAAKATGATRWNSTTPTSSVFSIGTATEVNASAETYVAYLFATIAKVSKVGTYTGNGSTQTINCGFTGGARFVLIKRTDSTGDWYVYDTARGMTTLTDPYLLLNSTAAETATLGSVTTVTTGFAVNAAILAAINTSAATYIFLAIA